ncbi:MAG: hypothetical protein LBK26_00245 [Rickettsiales bacterium]|jgi:hypothetical protein|nr:hypothetical protein [Rickettsiales bacterium]
MQIVKISMVGANEHLSEKDIIDFIRAYPLAEIGIGVSAGKGGRGTPRFDYVKSLQNEVDKKCFPGRNGTIALHVNGIGKDGESGWPYQALNGHVNDALSEMMHFPNMSLQVNHYGYEIPIENAEIFAHGSDLWRKIAPRARLILSYCDKTKEYVNTFYSAICELHDSHILNFGILYDMSFGNAVMAEKYAPPVFPNIIQGYAGGFSPDNIQSELVKIRTAQINPDVKIWIDAEGKLKSADGKTLDLGKAEKFYKKIIEFQR